MTTMTMTPAAVAETAKTYQIDPAHSEASFQVRHLLSRVRGRFTDLAGTITFDAAQPERSAVTVTIQAASIDTGQPDRDRHLRSDDFFAVETYPAITFESRAISQTGLDTFAVTGDLTIRGVTRPVTIPVTFLGQARDPWGQDKIAFEGEITLNRKDFGLNWNAVLETGGFLVGDDVKVTLSIQAQQSR